MRHLNTLFLIVACLTSIVQADDVTIRIVGNGNRAVFEPFKTEVLVGDRVQWLNLGTLRHTATSVRVDDEGEPIFDTGRISIGNKSRFVEVTDEFFEDRDVDEATGLRKSDYYCDPHPNMSGMLLLASTRTDHKKRVDVASEARATRTRLDILSLTPAMLDRYRDAWRELQESGRFARLAGHHGCPDRYCHQDPVAFLAWHREYILRLETELGEPLHYWDWTSPIAQREGIPDAFLEPFYVSPIDGQRHPNPLRSFRFSCRPMQPNPRYTLRRPRSPSLLTGYARLVRSSYLERTYRGFNSSVDVPHGNLHGWVSGDMQTQTYAAYDPIFFAHHANVDRQWASWQLNGGQDPSPSDQRRTLTGFGKRIGDVLSIRALGYEYQIYDRVPTVVRPSHPIILASSDSAETSAFGKSFQLDRRVDPVGDNVALFVTHPHSTEPLFIEVYLNNTRARPGKIRSSGNFTLFSSPDLHAKKGSTTRAVLILDSAEEVESVTFIATNPRGEIVDPETIPIEEIRFKTEDSRARTHVSRDGSFEGTSRSGSISDAFQAAIDEAQQVLLPGRGETITAEVSKIRGSRLIGGTVQDKTVIVEIKARVVRQE